MATMRGIDIGGSANSNFDVSLVRDQIDFCIVKATEGRDWTNKWCDREVQKCIKYGIPWGSTTTRGTTTLWPKRLLR